MAWDIWAMSSRRPLSALLSQALVAFTIEFDNEAEHRLPHRTTDYGRTAGSRHAPWLTSMAMWFNCMQHVGEQGIRLRELQRLAGTETNLDGMQRWGYIYLEPDPADPRPKPPKKDWLVRALPGGRMVRQVWEPLFAEIEQRWRERFGVEAIEKLREALSAIRLEGDLPDCLPIVGYGLFSSGDQAKNPPRKEAEARVAEPEVIAALPLPALLARVLLAFAMDFERSSTVSLALSANVLRVLDEKPTALRDLPELTGISTEYVAVSTGWLVRHGFAVIAKAPPPDRGKQIRLNEKGLVAQTNYGKRVAEIEKDWRERYGPAAVQALRTALEPLVGDGSAERSPLFRGLEPYPEGWRAKVRKPVLLPHFPMVTHRGGYPDGS